MIICFKKTIPIDCAVHPYRGSTTNEKLKVVSEYEDRKIEMLILQDGTNNVLKHHQKSAQDHFADHAKLVKKCIEKFQPEVFVICEVPPLKNLPQNMDKNNCIDEFNELIHSTYSNQIGFKILNVNKNIKEEGTSIDQTDDKNVGYNYLFFDNVHHRFGVPLLKNWMLSHLLLSSNGRIDNNVPSNNKVQTHSQGRSNDVIYAKANKIQFNRQHRFNPLYGSNVWQHQYNPNYASNASHAQYCNSNARNHYNY